RRPRQASGAFERVPLRNGAAEAAPRAMREPPLVLPEVRVRDPVAAAELPVVETLEDAALPGPESAQEPQTQEAQSAPENEDTVDDLPTLVLDGDAAAEDLVPPPWADEPGTGELLPQLPPGEPLVVDWPAAHERRIVALRLVAPQSERFPGRSLRQALA